MLAAWTFTNQRQGSNLLSSIESMNLQKHILFALVSPLMLSFSLPLETEQRTASNDSRPLSIRNLSENGAAFRDKSYYSNDDSSGQMLRLSSLINDANPRHGEEDNSVNVVEYLSGPNTMESLARSINDRLTIPAIYDGNTGIKDEDQDRQEVQAQVLQESITFFGIADTKAFPLFSYSYDTMPPTTNKELESPTPIFGISGPETASTGFAEPSDNLAPTVAMAADDDLLIIDESMDSTSRVPTQVPTSSATPTSTSRRSSKNRSRNTDGNMLGTNESKGYPMIRPQEEISVTNFDSTKSEPSTTAQADEVVHSPSLRPSVFQGTAIDIIEDVTCFPPCKETEEICRSRGKGGLGSCHPKCKSKKRCDFGDVCRSDGYCDR